MSTNAAPGMESKGMPLHVRVLIGFVLGAVLGLLAYRYGQGNAFVDGTITYVAQPIGQTFLNLLFMLVLPLMFSALVLGVAELGDIASLGRLGARTLWFTAALTGIAVLIGLLMVNLFAPGRGFDQATLNTVMAGSATRAHELATSGAEISWMKLVLGIVPRNIIVAAADDKQKLSVMFFALMLGVGLVLTPSPATQRFKEVLQGLFEIAMRLIGLVIRLAPYAVAALMFSLSARFGWDLLKTLGWFAFTVISALALHGLVVLPLWVRYVGGMPAKRFLRDSEEAILTAFATASSAATLPVTLRVAEQNLKLPTTVARFVLTIGAAANHHGSALFEGVTVLFLAQAFGVELALGQQALVLVLCIIGGIGTAGVPAGSLPVIALILSIIGVPPEGIGLILGVDRFLDMCRTALNVTGDLATAVVVAGKERGEIEPVPPAAG